LLREGFSRKRGGEWYNSYAPGIVDSGTRLFVNAGAGFGLFPVYTKMAVPPLEANVEYALPISLPISVGGFFCFAMGKEEFTPYYVTTYKYEDTETAMAFGLRAFYHFNFIKNLDTYAGLGLGWLIWNVKRDYSAVYTDTSYDYSTFFYDIRVGAKYFFTNNIGAYVEVGYNLISVVGVGLALKF
jgi:hypothetical protein